MSGTTDRQRSVFEATVADNRGSFTGGDWALFGGISLIWGASFLLIAYSLDGLTPGMTTLLRVGLGAGALWGLRLLLRRGERIAVEDRRSVLLLGVIWVAIPFTLFPLAQQWINSAVTGLLNGGTPVLVALVSVVFVKIRPRPLQLVGLALGFAGIVLISLGAAGGGASETRGVLLVLAAVCCYGFAINMAPPLQARYGAIVLMSSVLTVATVVVAPLALIGFADNDWRVSSLAAVVVLGVVGTGFAYWIMTTLVGRVGAVRASFITYLIPVVSLVLGIAFRGDDVATLALAGMPLTLVGAFIASRRDT